MDLDSVPLQRRPVSSVVPLTALQARTWRGIAKEGSAISAGRFPAACTRILGHLDKNLLHQCINELVDRHETLRTRFTMVDKLPRQQIDKNHGTRVELMDLSKRSAGDATEDARQVVQEFMHQRVDLSIGPLFDVCLLKLAESDHVLALGLDHMVCDGTSNTILNRELWSLYTQHLQQEQSSLPELPVQFADYALWQYQTLRHWTEHHAPYWKNRLGDAPQLQLRRTAIDPKCPSTADLRLSLGIERTSQLRRFARQRREPLSSVVLAIYAATLARWSSQHDFIIGFVHQARHRRELTNMIGFVADFVYLRVTIDARTTLVELLTQLNEQLQAARTHFDYGRAPDLCFTSVPGTFFNWTPAQWSPIDWSPWCDTLTSQVHDLLQTMPFPIRHSYVRTVDDSFQFTLSPCDTPGGLIFTMTYRSDLFSESQIKALFRNMQSFSLAFIDRVSDPVLSLPFSP